MHPNECDIETITFEKLLDAVKTERSQGTYGKYLKLICRAELRLETIEGG